MTEPEGVLRLTPEQKDRAVDVLLAAFFDDVAYRYVMPDAEERALALHRLWNALVPFCLRYGEVYTTTEVSGVACWLPVRSPAVGLWQLICTGFALPRAMLSLRGESRKRMGDVMQYNDVVHKNVVKGLHWYLGALGVTPDHQRRGIGGTLLQPILARANAEGRPCYLETETESNVRFYEKHGFRVASAGEVPGHPVRMWAMLRQPIPPLPEQGTRW